MVNLTFGQFLTLYSHVFTTSAERDKYLLENLSGAEIQRLIALFNTYDRSLAVLTDINPEIAVSYMNAMKDTPIKKLLGSGEDTRAYTGDTTKL